jgi:hypothetical protein
MKHGALFLVLAVLVIGVSISAGPVVWAVLVMLSPAVIFYVMVRNRPHGVDNRPGGIERH